MMEFLYTLVFGNPLVAALGIGMLILIIAAVSKSPKLIKILSIVSCFFHAVCVTFFWYLLPRGFPWFSSPFVEHQLIVPAIALISWGAACSLVRRARVGLLCTYVLLGSWIGLGLIIVIWFPLFFPPGELVAIGVGMLAVILGVVTVICAGWIRSFKLMNLHTTRWAKLVVLLGLALPFAILFVSKARLARTTPLNAVPELEATLNLTEVSDYESYIPVGDRSQDITVRLDRSYEDIELVTPEGTLSIRPYMRFWSISRNGFWAIFGNRDMSDVTIDQVSKGRYKDVDVLHFVWSASSYKSWLEPDQLSGEVLVERRSLEGHLTEVQITTITRLARQIDSHQSSYFDLWWYGRVPITLSIGDENPYNWVPTAYDYPFGAPATLMTVKDDHISLLRASSGEKGPFQELARFPKKDPPLRIVVADRTVCEFVLEGFVEQVSLEPSPTAGWDVRVNDIFLQGSRFDEDQPSSVGVGYTLAGTGTGLGFHATGIAPGIYVSRLRVSVP